MRACSAAYLAIGSLCFPCVAAASGIIHHWVQLGDHSSAIVRAIVATDTCPELRVDGRRVAMERRAPATVQHPAPVCEKRIPRSAANLVLDGRSLPAPKPEVERVAVIGDTGCRIKGKWAQACNSPGAWPLDAVVAAIVRQQPDLVIHVGDYLYRASPCPEPRLCRGSPYGDNLRTWVADWFGPAQPLLSKAPLVFVRGNHEACGRGDEGWFRYLSAGPIPAECTAVSEPWKASAGSVELMVFDASDGPAPQSSVRHRALYRRMAEASFATLERESWFLTHRPLWVHLRAFGEIIDGDDTQRASFGDLFPPTVSMILSGHIHGFQVLDMASAPVQVISGNGGTELDPMSDEEERDIEIAGYRARQVISDTGFGFLLLTRDGDSAWRAEAFDERGERRQRCRLSGRDLACAQRSP